MDEKIISFGDSLTEGRPGSSYIDLSVNKRLMDNHGRGGDTLRGVSSRISTYLEDHPIDRIILLVGTNDILHDLLEPRSFMWEQVARNSIAAKGLPCRTPEEYGEAYQRLLDHLSHAQKYIISIPCIGEDITSEVNRKVDSYNRVLSGIAREAEALFIDFNSQMKEYLKGRVVNADYILGKSPAKTIADTFIPARGELDLSVSRGRGLHLTLDGVHLNQLGARMLADMIDSVIC